MSEEIPSPKRGGTFLYCPWDLHAWSARFRTAKAYRRHWRRYHAGADL